MNYSTMSFNQALHGYDDGHTLIASSIELPAEVKRIMLLLSDMSGSRMQDGFEEYITGYPIKELNVYAIAKTWYAPEMKRPGCVWTHTILIELQDVPKLLNLKVILSLFKRPEPLEIDRQNYLYPIEADPQITEHDVIRFNKDSITQNARVILKGLYEIWNKPSLIRSSFSKDLEILVLMIWRQQWPRLKRNFSFCTGAISPRKLAGNLLDLQIIPNSTDMFNLTPDDAYFIDLYSSNVNTTTDWIDFVTFTLFDSSNKINSFFNYFGSDVSIKRSSFKRLTKAYLFFTSEQPSVQSSIKLLATYFPSIKEGSNLKSTILYKNKSELINLPSHTEEELLFHLSITTSYPAFDYKKLEYESRFTNYFENLNENIIRLLKNIIVEGPNIYGEAAIKNIATNLIDINYFKLLRTDKQLLQIFINLNPTITYTEVFWEVNYKDNVEIINQLKKNDIGQIEWQKILNVLFKLNIYPDPKLFDGQFDCTHFFLNYIKINGFILTNNTWFNFLKDHPTDVINWFDNNHKNLKPEIILFILGLLNPNSKSVLAYPIDSWLQVIDAVTTTSNHTIKVEVYAFSFGLAFNSYSDQAQKIIELTFEFIYFSLANDKLEYRLWQNIECHTKRLTIWDDWDRCKKICIAVVDLYIFNNWSIKKLINHITSENLKERLLKQYKKRK